MSKVLVENGPYTGLYISTPNNFDAVSSKEDRAAVVTVFTALLHIFEGIDYMEVEDSTMCGKMWVLAVYGWKKRPGDDERLAIKQATRGIVIDTVFTDLSKGSQHHGKDDRQRFGAIVVHVRKVVSSPLLLGSTEPFIVKDMGTGKSRSDALLHGRASSSSSMIPIKTHKKEKESAKSQKKKIKQCLKNRSLLSWVYDIAVGVSEDGIEEVISRQNRAYQPLDD
jgi:hypothetical protein